MQESRRRSRLEQRLLSLSAAWLLACSSGAPKPQVATAATEVPPPPQPQPQPQPQAEPAPAPSASVAPSATSAAEPAPATAESPAPAPAPIPELPKNTLVLHVGDSFAASLGLPLGKRFKAAGVRYILEYETASYVPTWAFGKALPKFIAKYNPDFVMVTLGANEIEITNPEQRAGAVKRLVKELGNRPCLWVLPPLWKADTGFMKVIRDNAAPCRCLDSTALVGDLPRKKDKIHPNEEGREVWAEAVFNWLGRERQGSAERPWALKAP